MLIKLPLRREAESGWMDLLFERVKDPGQEVLNHYGDTRKWLKHRLITTVHALLRETLFSCRIFVQPDLGIVVLVWAAWCHRKAAECCCMSAHS